MVAVPTDGRLTSQNILTIPLAGSEVMYIVAPGTAAQGNSYQTTLDYLAAFFSAFPSLNSELITAGATLATPWQVLTTDTRLLFNKTLGSASYAVLPLAASLTYLQPVLFKDLKGDASTNPITISFTGGELCEGQSTIMINNPWGWVTLNPIPGGGGWYQT